MLWDRAVRSRYETNLQRPSPPSLQAVFGTGSYAAFAVLALAALVQRAAAQSDPALTQGGIIGIGVGIGLGVGIPAVLAVIWIWYFYCSHQSPPITALAREEDLQYTLPAKDTVRVPIPSTSAATKTPVRSAS